MSLERTPRGCTCLLTHLKVVDYLMSVVTVSSRCNGLWVLKHLSDIKILDCRSQWALDLLCIILGKD